MRRIYRLQKSQYRLEQEQIKAPKHLIENIYQEMQQYQLTYPDSLTEVDPSGTSQIMPPKSTVLTIPAVCVIVTISLIYYFATTSFNNDMQQTYEDELYLPEVVEYAEESQSNDDDSYIPDTQEIFTHDDETTNDELTPDHNNNVTEQAPPSNEGGGRFELIIRPSQD